MLSIKYLIKKNFNLRFISIPKGSISPLIFPKNSNDSQKLDLLAQKSNEILQHTNAIIRSKKNTEETQQKMVMNITEIETTQNVMKTDIIDMNEVHKVMGSEIEELKKKQAKTSKQPQNIKKWVKE